MLISVVISLYNKQECIKKTIQSVLNQSFDNFEVIVVNDGSTDQSVQIVSELTDSRIRIINKENGGVSSARNMGIEKSTGEYIYLLDADDVIQPNCLQTFHQLIIDYPNAEVYTSNFEMIDGEKSRKICKGMVKGYVENPLKSRWKRIISPRIGNMLVKKSVFDRIGYYKTTISMYEDLEFNIRLLSNCRVAYTPEVTFEYHRGHSQLSFARKPIESEFCWHISFSNTSFYQKLLLADNINRSIFNRLKRKDFKTVLRLIWKYRKYTLLLFIALIYLL